VWKSDGQAYTREEKIELLHDTMEGKDYSQLKVSISNRTRWIQDNKKACLKPAGDNIRLKKMKYEK